MKQITLLLLMFAMMTMQAQQLSDNFTMSQDNFPWSYDPAGTIIFGDSNIDDGNVTIPIGFDFEYLGDVYTELTISTNGAISFTGDAVYYGNTFDGTSEATSNILAPLWDDLYLRTADAGEISYISNEEYFKIQWKNVSWRNTGQTVNFSLFLYPDDNILFWYGDNNSTDTRSASIGMNKGTTGDNFISVTPGDPVTTSATVSNNSISTADYPGSGVYYYFERVRPTNDNICNAIPLTVGEISTGDAYTTVYATTQTDEPAGSCWFDGDGVDNSVWFGFEATATNMTISTDYEGGTMTDTQFSVYADPTDCADASTLGAEIGCDEDSGDIGLLSYLELTGLTVEDTYYIQVDGYGGEEGTFGISVIITPPANDECDAAIELLVGDSFDENAIESTLFGATEDYDVADVWFSVTVPDSGNLTIETGPAAGSTMDDTYMYLFEACGEDYIDADDNNGEGNFSKLTLTGQTPGDNLIIAVVKDISSPELDAFMVSAYDHTIGIADATIKGFAMYPNPVEDVLNLNAQNTIDAVSIYNLLGQEVLNATPSATETQINMSNLPTGAYIVKVQAGEQVGSYNLIKE